MLLAGVEVILPNGLKEIVKGIILLSDDDLPAKAVTARKIIFPRFRNIMESSKRPSIYHLFITFLAEKKTVLSITVKFKTRTSH